MKHPDYDIGKETKITHSFNSSEVAKATDNNNYTNLDEEEKIKRVELELERLAIEFGYNAVGCAIRNWRYSRMSKHERRRESIRTGGGYS